MVVIQIKNEKRKKKRGEMREKRKAPSGFTSTQHTLNGFSDTRVLLREARHKWFHGEDESSRAFRDSERPERSRFDNSTAVLGDRVGSNRSFPSCSTVIR